MKAFVIAETAEGVRALCAGARGMAEEVVLIAPGVEPLTGVADKVVHVTVPSDAVLDEAYLTVNAIFDAEEPSLVLVEPTRRMKVIGGRLAAHAGTAVITDAVELVDGVATSLYFGGVGQRKCRAIGSPAVYTVAPSLFNEADASGTDIVEEVVFEIPDHAVRVISVREQPAGEVDLTAADVVVAAGRGFAEEADLQLLRDFAAKIGGECGCSRPLAEGEGWMPKETYIGVSGLMLSPKVYVGAGVSGQMQHMVGVSRAGTIFAINKDKNAPVFKQCDWGLVGDIKDVLPALTAAL